MQLPPGRPPRLPVQVGPDEVELGAADQHAGVLEHGRLRGLRDGQESGREHDDGRGTGWTHGFPSRDRTPIPPAAAGAVNRIRTYPPPDIPAAYQAGNIPAIYRSFIGFLP
ncbi:hypothetical protein GCM10023334_117250 [Nonomuraea thailandensis]